MNDDHITPLPAAPGAQVALELQDQLLCATAELERLQSILDDAARGLLLQFSNAHAALLPLLAQADATPPGVREALDALAQATQGLQFQDMSAQLVAYTQQRVRHCADRLASLALADDDEPAVVQAAPQRPNPVIQDEMDSGLIELF